MRPELFPTIGFCAMTICLHTQHCLSRSFGEKIDCGPETPHLLTRSHFMWLLPIPYHKESSQGIIFRSYGRDSEGYDGHSKLFAVEWLLEFALTAAALEFMCSCRRELLWRRLLQSRIKVNIVLSVSTVTLFICQTSYPWIFMEGQCHNFEKTTVWIGGCHLIHQEASKNLFLFFFL
jgi:hypothetical protein